MENIQSHVADVQSHLQNVQEQIVADIQNEVETSKERNFKTLVNFLPIIHRYFKMPFMRFSLLNYHKNHVFKQLPSSKMLLAAIFYAEMVLLKA